MLFNFRFVVLALNTQHDIYFLLLSTNLEHQQQDVIYLVNTTPRKNINGFDPVVYQSQFFSYVMLRMKCVTLTITIIATKKKIRGAHFSKMKFEISFVF